MQSISNWVTQTERATFGNSTQAVPSTKETTETIVSGYFILATQTADHYEK